MSHAASKYVKHLVKAPDGSRITPTEKAVLSQLADDHNEELGIAWPSMKDLARRSCLSERGCRKVIATLERKQVIRRIATCRAECGGQSSNEYQFLDLDNPPVTAKQTETRRRLQRIPRNPMPKLTGGPRPKRPPVSEPNVRGSLTSATGGPGTIVPPIEHLTDTSGELVSELLPERFPPTPHDKARGEQSLASVFPQGEGKQAEDFKLMCIAWAAGVNRVHDALMASVPVKLESRPGYRNGLQDWQEHRFGDMAAESVEMIASGILLRVSSPDLVATQAGLEKYGERWKKALSAAFGRPVQIELCHQAP